MTVALNFTTPAQALNAMVDAGAVFTVRHRKDVLGASFTYRVADGGDIEHCRQILAHVKSKPPQFFAALRAAIQENALKDVATSSTGSGSEEGAETPPSTVSRRIIGGAGAPSTSADAKVVVSTSPTNAGRGAA